MSGFSMLKRGGGHRGYRLGTVPSMTRVGVELGHNGEEREN